MNRLQRERLMEKLEFEMRSEQYAQQAREEQEKEANESVLGFIFDFVWCKASNINEYELIRSLFMDGYCYYFAVILKTAFNRGEICWCAPYAHFIWLDTNGIPYDIEGVSTA